MTTRLPVSPAPGPLEAFAQHFDPLFPKRSQRQAFRDYLAGLLLPAERNKTLTALANTEPIVGAQAAPAQRLQWFLSESTWDADAVNACRLAALSALPATAPDANGALVIDETGDRKNGTHTAHVGRQYLGSIGKIDNGVVSVGALWADEQVYYPLDVEPYTPAHWFARGKSDPAFRTKPQIALALVEHAVAAGIPFCAVVADCFYGEHDAFRLGLHTRGVGYVLALQPSHAWWHPIGSIGSLWEVAAAAEWGDADHPGAWMPVVRTFRDGHTETWWALEIVAGPYGPAKAIRAVVATTDPTTLPELSTWYLVTNLPAPVPDQRDLAHPSADVAEIVRLYGFRIWVEQSYKQVKQALGWAQYQVRGDRAIRRHWQLVCCAFSFCWWAARLCRAQPEAEAPAGDEECDTPATEPDAGRGGEWRVHRRAHWSRGRWRYAACGHGWNRGHYWNATGARGAIGPRRPRCGGCLTGCGRDTRLTAMTADNKLPLVVALGFGLLQSVGSVVAVNDTTPPVFQSLSISSANVAAGGTFTATAHITDDITGVDANSSPYISYRFSGPSGQSFAASFVLTSGNAQDGIYQAFLHVPAAYPSGSYYVSYLYATDAASNSTQVNYPAPPTTSGTITVGNAAPTLTGLNPASVPAGGGAFALTVFGSNFQSGAKVYWNGSLRTTTFVRPTQLTATITAADITNPGTANILVVNPDGQGTSSGLTFTITVPPPKPQTLSVTSGPSAGGTTVTLTGKYFQPGATVTFGGVSATGVTVVSATQITAVTPASSSGGLVDVAVKNPDGMSGTLPSSFMYILRPGPVIPGAQASPEAGGRTVPANPGSQPGAMPIHR